MDGNNKEAKQQGANVAAETSARWLTTNYQSKSMIARMADTL